MEDWELEEGEEKMEVRKKQKLEEDLPEREKAALVGAPEHNQVYLNTENKCCTKPQKINKIENPQKNSEIENHQENIETQAIDWDIEIEKHRNELETEMIEKNKNEKLKVEKERTWELYEECKLYLERNERCWEVRKLEREAEIKKKERLQIANAKKENIREKVRIRTLEKEIEKAKGDLPEEVRKEIER